MPRQLWFTSSKFSPVLGEEEKTNPGRFGQALAAWIREMLVEQGYPDVESPIPEDWGWVVMVQRKPFPLWIGCGNEDERTNRWGLFVKAEPVFLGKLLVHVDPSSVVNDLEGQIERMIRAEPGCTDVAWEHI